MGTSAQVEKKRREAPRMIRFATGECVEGILDLRERITIQGKPVIRYTVKQDNGEYVTFLGTADLITKLRAADVGLRVSITCIGEDTMVKRGDNCMKLFEVDVWEPVHFATSQGDGDGTQITDEDIPF